MMESGYKLESFSSFEVIRKWFRGIHGFVSPIDNFIEKYNRGQNG